MRKLCFISFLIFLPFSFAQQLELVEAETGKQVAVFQPGDKILVAGKEYFVRGEGAKEIEAYLRQVEVPRVDLMDVTLGEALDFLRMKEIENGSGEVVFGSIRVENPALSDRMISRLNMREISLHEALVALSELCDVRIDFTEESVVLRDAPIAKSETKVEPES